MRYNTGRIDRSLRILIALIIIAAGFYYQSLWGVVGIIEKNINVFDIEDYDLIKE